MSIQAFTKEISTMSGEQLIKLAMGPYSVFIELFDEMSNNINVYCDEIHKIYTPGELAIACCVWLGLLAMIIFVIKIQEDRNNKLILTNENKNQKKIIQ